MVYNLCPILKTYILFYCEQMVRTRSKVITDVELVTPIRASIKGHGRCHNRDKCRSRHKEKVQVEYEFI